MGHHRKSEWLRDIYPRLGRFWYLLGTRQSMNALQWTGLLGLFVFYLTFLALLVLRDWPTGSTPWWRKVFEAYGFYLVLWVVVIFVIFGGSWLASRRHRRGFYK